MCWGVARAITRHQRGEIVVGERMAERRTGECSLLIGCRVGERLEGGLVGQEVQAARGDRRHQDGAAEACRVGRARHRARSPHRGCARWRPGRPDRARRTRRSRRGRTRRSCNASHDVAPPLAPHPTRSSAVTRIVPQVEPFDERIPRAVVVLEAVDDDHVAPDAGLVDGDLGLFEHARRSVASHGVGRPPSRPSCQRVSCHRCRVSPTVNGARSRRLTAVSDWRAGRARRRCRKGPGAGSASRRALPPRRCGTSRRRGAAARCRGRRR